MIGAGETKREMVQRQVREGRERLGRQRTLVLDLIRDGHHGLVPAAKKFLGEMEQYQAEIEHSLENLSEDPSAPPQSLAPPSRPDAT